MLPMSVFELLDERRIHPCCSTRFRVELSTGGATGVERRDEIADKGVPGIEIRRQPSQPTPPESHMTDLVTVNVIEERSALEVAAAARDRSDFEAVIEVRILEGQGHRGNELERRFQQMGFVPEIAAHREIAEGASSPLECFEVDPSVGLFLEKDVEEIATKIVGSIHVQQQGAGIELDRLQLVVGEGVEESPALLRILPGADSRNRRLLRRANLERLCARRLIGNRDHPTVVDGDLRRTLELRGQIR